MDLILETDGSLGKAVGQDELSEQESLAIRFLRLSSWMMILGTVRLVSALGDYGSSFLDISPSWYPSLSVITRFFHENPLGANKGTGVIFLSVGAIVALLRPNDELKNDSRTLILVWPRRRPDTRR